MAKNKNNKKPGGADKSHNPATPPRSSNVKDFMRGLNNELLPNTVI